MAKPGCVFCEVVAEGAPAHVVAQTADAVAFLDRRPLFHGHTLVVPRHHVETLVDLPASQLATLFELVQLLAAAMVGPFGAKGTFVAMNNIVSQSVPHLHVHVVPRNPKDGLRGFFWPRGKYDSDEQAAQVADRVRLAFSATSNPTDEAIGVEQV